MRYVQGDILTVDGLQKNYHLGFEKGKIIEKGKGKPSEKPVASGFILPTIVNSHTHIGDSFIKKRNKSLPKDLEKLVAPPDGLKHRLLEDASEEEIISGMKESILEMEKNGISCFCDFRENGLKGINFIKESLKNMNISSFVFSRSNELKYDKSEIEALLKVSDGIGISSISDLDYTVLEKIAYHVHRKNKLFALHASEAFREDIDLILDLKPDLLIHMIYASSDDLELVAERDIPVVVCPRANLFFGLKPKLSLMKKTGIRLLLGTDNAMISNPNVIDEIRHIRKTNSGFSLTELFNMVTYNPRSFLDMDNTFFDNGSLVDFVVLDKKSLKPIFVSSAQKRREYNQ